MFFLSTDLREVTQSRGNLIIRRVFVLNVMWCPCMHQWERTPSSNNEALRYVIKLRDSSGSAIFTTRYFFLIRIWGELISIYNAVNLKHQIGKFRVHNNNNQRTEPVVYILSFVMSHYWISNMCIFMQYYGRFCILIQKDIRTDINLTIQRVVSNMMYAIV